MQRNATSIEQMRRKIEDLYAQPPVAPPTLASLREIYLPEMLSQVRQDMRDSIGELHRGVSRHLAEQQKQLSQQVWYNLQPATRIVELAHRFVELENVRSKGRGRAHSTGP